MRSWRRLVHIISDAEPTNSADSVQALLKGYKAAIRGTTGSPSVLCAPRIVLCFGACSSAEKTHAKSQREQHQPHYAGSLGGPQFWRSIRITPLVPSIRVWSGRWLVLRVRLTEAAEPARGVHALFKGYETAIRAAARLTAVNRAPRIVLCLGWSIEQSRRIDESAFFQRQIEECRELARHAVNAEDRAFWQHAAERWEGLLKQIKETAPRKTEDAAKQQRVA